jgi:hypothetical protein
LIAWRNEVDRHLCITFAGSSCPWPFALALIVSTNAQRFASCSSTKGVLIRRTAQGAADGAYVTSTAAPEESDVYEVLASNWKLASSDTMRSAVACSAACCAVNAVPM